MNLFNVNRHPYNMMKKIMSAKSKKILQKYVNSFTNYLEKCFDKVSSLANHEKADFIPLKAFASTLLPIPIVMYAYTLGFIHNFGVPVSPTVNDAVYFSTGLLLASMPDYPISTYLDFISWQGLNWYLIALIVSFFTATFISYSFKEKSYLLSGKKTLHLLKKIPLAEIIFFILLNITYIHYVGLDLNSYNTFFLSDGINLSSPPNTKVNISKVLFGILSVLIFAFPFLTDLIARNFRSVIVHKIGFRMTILFFSILFAYHLTVKYSGEYFNLPTARLGADSIKPQKIIWIDGDNFYLLNCRGSLKTEGYKNDKVFFSKDIDGKRNRTACSNM